LDGNIRTVLYYADQFVLPLPDGHRFPMAKYSLLRERLEESGAFSAGDFRVPPAATDEEITRAHCPEYLRRVQSGALSKDEIREIGFPWSPEMVERSRRSSGATLVASRIALQRGWAANLAGGTHHAGHAKGEGFCVFNDAAIAARAMQSEGLAQRVAIIDCDVHQGNGTAAIFADDDSVFTFSIHGARNYPFRREAASDLDIDLPDGTVDSEYSQALEGALDYVLRSHQPDHAIYLAGADPYQDDRLGRLKLTKAGLAARDELVLSRLKDAGIPVAIAMAGGYARDIRDTVDIHAMTLITARRLLG
jgi:acetoin utilization deacetylase AcuC-like enzyme